MKSFSDMSEQERALWNQLIYSNAQQVHEEMSKEPVAEGEWRRRKPSKLVPFPGDGKR